MKLSDFHVIKKDQFYVMDKGCEGKSLHINYKTSIVVLACFTILGL